MDYKKFTTPSIPIGLAIRYVRTASEIKLENQNKFAVRLKYHLKHEKGIQQWIYMKLL